MTASKWAKANGGRYVGKTQALAAVITTLTPKQVLAFVLFTPQQRYEVAVKDWKHWMRFGDVREGNFWRTRRAYIGAIPPMFDYDRGTTWPHYVSYLANSIRGLSYVKAPFFCSLMEPTSMNVPVCMDVHMLRFMGWSEWKGKMAVESWDLYHELQDNFRKRAHRAQMPTFAYQWAVWDYVRSSGEPVKETHIENDLDVYNSLRGREGRL